jgi:hypothetical protein
MVGLTITGNPIATVGASNSTIKGTYTITQADIDAGKVVNTALLQRKIRKEICNRYLWNYRDKRYAYGYPIDTNPRIALVSCSRWNRKSR